MIKSYSLNETHRHGFAPMTLALTRWPWYTNLIYIFRRCTCVPTTIFLG